MLQTQVSELAKLLDARYERLQHDIRDQFERNEMQVNTELDERPGDMADQAASDQVTDLNLAFVERRTMEMHDIEAAKARLNDGTFGTCMNCGKQINFARLQARPTAVRCLGCQRDHDKLYAKEETPSL